MTKPSGIRVLVVDDSVVVRQLVSDALRNDPAVEVVGTAQNGKVALERIAALKPDVMTLDLEMPEMDGLATLRELSKRRIRLPVIVFSTLTERGASATVEALACGASDYLCKPSGQRSVQATTERIRDELLPKIHALHARNRPVGARPAAPPMPVRAQPTITASAPVELVVIAVSTGGPGALAALLPQLSAKFPYPIMIVQHMPPLFTRTLAQRFNTIGPLKVREAINHEPLRPGHVYIAPGDYHMRVAGGRREAWARLDQGPPENGCRPAADPLFQSAAEVYGAGVLGLVLTGLGHDATQGAAAVCQAGGRIWVQDEATSTVWGMPGSVVQAGYASRVLPLPTIARALSELTLGPARSAELCSNPPRK